MDFLKQTILLVAERDFQASKRPAAKKLADPDGQASFLVIQPLYCMILYHAL